MDALRKRKVAASLWIWSEGLGQDHKKNAKLLEMISGFGFDGVEIPTFDGKLDGRKIRETLVSTGNLTPIVIGGGSPETDLSSEHDSTREQGRAYVKRLIDLCDTLGGEIVGGPLYCSVGQKKLLSAQERSKVLDIVAKELRVLSNYAKDRSVGLALEPLCRYDTHFINTIAQGKELVDRIGAENVGMLLDTFHMNIEEKSFADAIRRAGANLFHFHACENDRGTPGTGLISWDEIRTALDEAKYDRWIALESFVPERDGFSAAMNVWRHIEPEQDAIARDGLRFIRKTLC